jgi:hypothetical protein
MQKTLVRIGASLGKGYLMRHVGEDCSYISHLTLFTLGLATGEKATCTSTVSAPVTGASGVAHAAHPASMYMGDSLGEGYFGGMEDLLGGGHSDEGEEFRKSLAHLQNTKFAGDAEGRGEKNADTERIESRSDQDIELRGTDERIGEPNKMEPGIILILSPILTINNLWAKW